MYKNISKSEPIEKTLNEKQCIKTLKTTNSKTYGNRVKDNICNAKYNEIITK